jgi:dihydropteroate synthase
MRSSFQWRLRSRTVALGSRTLLMGVLNVTPDSFSDGGRFLHPQAAVERGLQMLAEGADIIDVGGESTRPGVPTVREDCCAQSLAVSVSEELRRVLPVIEGIKRAAPGALISVDTYKSEVARVGLAAGAEIVNDVSALRWDPDMGPALAESGCGVVLMHSRGRPDEWKTLPPLGAAVITLISRELGEWAAAAENHGIAHDRIVIDPGFGFGKDWLENYVLLAHLQELQCLGYPLLAATSRKSFIGRAVSRPSEPANPERRLYGTLASVAACILKGAHIVRVHDVEAAREAAAVCDQIVAAGQF